LPRGTKQAGSLYFLTSSTTALRRGLLMPHSLTAAAPPDAREAIAAAYDAHYGVLEYVVVQRFRIPDADVRPLIHDVFVSYIRHRPRIRDPRAWLLGAIFNSSRQYWRGRGREEDQSWPLTVEGIVAMADDVATRVDVSTVLRRLPKRCREVLRLRFYEEYSSEELARHFQTTAGYARKMVHRCILNARAMFERMAGARS
jgi:RNA polymerase sigma factor (sigma-70 family)